MGIGEISDTSPLLGRWIGEKYAPGHLDAYRLWMLAKGRTPKQIHEVCTRARKMIRLCGFTCVADTSAETLEVKVGTVLRGVRKLCLKTCNDYLKSPSQLLRWMARPRIGRAPFNPLADVEKYNIAEDDPRHARRPLPPEQVLKVIADTRGRGMYRRMSGLDRAIYYTLKLHTGLRNIETESLTPESFDLQAIPPTVRVRAAFSKHRRLDVQPLLQQIVETELRAWLATKKTGKPVFAVGDKPYLMWRADLEASGFTYCENGRFADLHALRHIFGTELGRAPGVTIKTVQTLMRHSDIRLTAQYMHSSREDQIQALAHLPMPANLSV